MTLVQLRRIRWGVRAVLMLGVAASVVANVLHAIPNPISQSIAAWPPLALLLTVELISRIPVHSRALGAARVVATTVIAGIAAWVSYWHMAGVASRYGETGAAPYLIPISVDGLIVVASICLVELGGRIRTADTTTGVDHDGPLMVRLDYPAPIGPMPAPGRVVDHEDQAVPDPVQAAPERTRAARVRRRLTAAERITAAHSKNPDATHHEIAAAARVSLTSVKRHRPRRTPDQDQTAPEVPELVHAPA
ncbi:DUF2637 domain-containing protein [Actinoplanes sp. NPDC049316]|uniref:DUF2637 domain-containing protein n=1 Tax=Actinoplanes sp. NPDC049316 TaxID=3154727 RepID=UPI0034240A22